MTYNFKHIHLLLHRTMVLSASTHWSSKQPNVSSVSWFCAVKTKKLASINYYCFSSCWATEWNVKWYWTLQPVKLLSYINALSVSLETKCPLKRETILLWDRSWLNKGIFYSSTLIVRFPNTVFIFQVCIFLFNLLLKVCMQNAKNWYQK